MLANTAETITLALFIIGIFGGSLELAMLAIAGWIVVSYVREDKQP